jgi:hypothetical protein
MLFEQEEREDCVVDVVVGLGTVDTATAACRPGLLYDRALDERHVVPERPCRGPTQIGLDAPATLLK